MTSSRALAPISTLPFLDQPLHGRVDQRLELGDGVAVDLEVPAERVAHLGLLPFPAAVFAEHEHASLPPQLVDPRAVVAGSLEDQIGPLDDLAREQPRAMAGEIEAALQSHQIRPFRRRGPVPRPRARRFDGHALETPLLQGALEQRLREGTAADVARADEEDAHRQGARRPTARRSSATGRAPARTMRGVAVVQSITVEGGRLPSTPPSSTSRRPASTAAVNSRTMASGPGAVGPPGRLADVDVNGSPSAATSRATCGCEVQRTAIPPSGPRSVSGSRPPPPGSTSVRGPGQNARASASAALLNAKPCASAIRRSLTSRRNGLSARRPLSSASARTSSSRARDPKPYTVSVG